MTAPLLPFASVPDGAAPIAASPAAAPDESADAGAFTRALASAMQGSAGAAPDAMFHAALASFPGAALFGLTHSPEPGSQGHAGASNDRQAPARTQSAGDDPMTDTVASAAADATTPTTPAGLALGLAVASLVVPAHAAIGEPEPAGPSRAAAVQRDPALLRPDVRTRIEALVQRMHDEYGYTVEIVETARSQERQDALYRQGRTAPGPVVTWTRASHHTQGTAADVVIDGGHDDPVAWQRLGRIAAEEGLHTLGPRDPGHVELAAPPSLRGIDALSASTLTLGRTTPLRDVNGSGRPVPRATDGTAAGDVPRPAALARVAAVAAPAVVARVATVAPVAVPGVAGSSMTRATRGRAGETTAAVTTVAPVSLAVAGADDAAPPPARGITVPYSSGIAPGPAGREAVAQDASAHDAGTRELSHERTRGDAGSPTSGDEATAVPLAGADGGRKDAAPAPRHAAPGSVGAAHSTEHIAHLFEMRDHAAERPLSSVLLRFDHPDGGEERVRVDLRGTSVGATFDVRDGATARELTQHVGELTRALERQGLDPEPMTIRAVRASDAALPAAVAAGGERDIVRGAAPAAGGELANRGDRGHARQDHSRQGESPRQRPRRDARGDRQ